MHHSTIRRAKAQVRAKDKNNVASTAGGAKPPLQPAVMHQLMQFRTIAGRRTEQEDAPSGTTIRSHAEPQ